MEWIKALLAANEKPGTGVAGTSSTEPVEQMQARAAAVDPALVRQERPDLFEEWMSGALLPRRCTLALDAVQAQGAWVDAACGATEPEVDLWEAGQLYPSWENTVRLAALTGTLLEALLSREPLAPEPTFTRCGNSLFGKELRQSFLPALVELTVSADPAPASVSAASSIVEDAFTERFKDLLG